MPAITNITVKKADNVTDVIYVAKTPAAGDASPAIWRQDAHPAPYLGLKPELRVTSRWNGPKTARRVNLDFVYKAYATNSTTGISEQTAAMPFTVSVAIPQMGMSAADISEAAYQLGNLLVSTLLRSTFVDGFAPN